MKLRLPRLLVLLLAAAALDAVAQNAPAAAPAATPAPANAPAAVPPSIPGAPRPTPGTAPKPAAAAPAPVAAPAATNAKPAAPAAPAATPKPAAAAPAAAAPAPEPAPAADAAPAKKADKNADTAPPPPKPGPLKPPSCAVAEFRAIGIDTVDEQTRRAKATAWLKRKAKDCTAEQLIVMRNNRAQWLGSADSAEMALLIDGLLESFAETNRDVSLLLYGTPPPPPPPDDKAKGKDKNAAPPKK